MTDPITTPAQMREAAIYYIDCEFDGHSGPLLSLAIVRDDGYSTHIRVNIDANDPWVQANVMPIMDNHRADIAVTVDPDSVGQAIRDFIGPSEHPLIIADSTVDIGRFCAAISTAPDGQWSSVDYPKISFAVHNVTCYPTKLVGAVQHNAWWDAMALRDILCRALPMAEPERPADCVLGEAAGASCWVPPEYAMNEVISDCARFLRSGGGDQIAQAEPEPQAVRVKPLQWHKSHMSGWNGDWHTVSTDYTIRCADEIGWKWLTPLGAHGYERSPEAAQAAAEADHASRVRLQIDAVSVAQVRAEALREAVKLADEKHRAYFTAKGRNPDDYVSEYSQLAASIRALIEKEQT